MRAVPPQASSPHPQTRSEGMPGGCHGLCATGGAPWHRPPGCVRPGKGLEVDPKRLRMGTQPLGFAASSRGGTSACIQPPPGRYQEQRWQPALARGQAQEGATPEPLGEGNNPRAFLFFFFLAGPVRAAPPSPFFFFFSCAPLPVLLPRWGAELQLNQCSANNLPANKAFSSLSSSPPLHPNPRVMGAL